MNVRKNLHATAKSASALFNNIRRRVRAEHKVKISHPGRRNCIGRRYADLFRILVSF